MCDHQGEELALEDEKVLNEMWLKSGTALNVAKLELIQLKKKNLETGDTSQSRTDAARQKGTCTAH